MSRRATLFLPWSLALGLMLQDLAATLKPLVAPLVVVLLGIAMARTQAPHSATAQFFINVADNDFLNFRAPDLQGWGYCVFGRVTEGMDVVDSIRKVKTGSSGFHQDVPKEDVIIERAEVV